MWRSPIVEIKVSRSSSIQRVESLMEGAVSNALKGSLSDLQLFLRGHELDWKPDSVNAGGKTRLVLLP